MYNLEKRNKHGAILFIDAKKINFSCTKNGCVTILGQGRRGRVNRSKIFIYYRRKLKDLKLIV